MGRAEFETNSTEGRKQTKTLVWVGEITPEGKLAHLVKMGINGGSSVSYCTAEGKTLKVADIEEYKWSLAFAKLLAKKNTKHDEELEVYCSEKEAPIYKFGTLCWQTNLR